MKLPCEIVQDLLPVYEDDMCSALTREAVEEHLNTCPKCKEEVDQIRGLKRPELAPSELPESDRAVMKSFRKIRRRWWISVLAALLVVPVLLLSVNQYRGQGICFTNLDDLWAARKYCAALAAGDFEKAAGYMDYGELYNQVQDVLSWEPEHYVVEYIPVTIGSGEYMAMKGFYEDYLQDRPEELDFWSDMVFNGRDGCMIPQAVWNAVCALEPDAVEKPDDQTYQVNGTSFHRIETPWGIYLTTRDELAGVDDPGEYAYYLELLPLELYREAEEDIRAEELYQYRFNQEYYAEARGMTREEFEAYVKASYVTDLNHIADRGYTFELDGYDFSYYIGEDGCWTICYRMRLIKETDVHRFTISIQVQSGGLDVSAMTMETPEIRQFDLAEILFFSYPDE